MHGFPPSEYMVDAWTFDEVMNDSKKATASSALPASSDPSGGKCDTSPMGVRIVAA
jgi:hypothetical protein